MSYTKINASLIGMYLKFGKNVDAYKLFDEMPIRGKRVYDFVLYGFASGGFLEEVLVVFVEMLELGFHPCVNSVRYAIVSCGALRRIDKGRWVHDFAVDNGLDNVSICNSLISMYIKMGQWGLARCTFDAMEERDLVSWNSLITGYAQSGNCAEAFKMYLSMKKYGNISHNYVTLLGLACACGKVGNLDQGKSIHGQSIRAGILSDFRLGTAIMDMYAKCGSIECAEMLFEEGIFEKSLVSWNSLICGYSKARSYNKALILFKNLGMHETLKPDSITLTNVIPAYSALGRIDGIKSLHALILKKGFEIGADVVLGTTMIDAYGKCFDVTSAECLFNHVKGADTPTWNAMLGTYYLNDDATKGMLLLLKMLRGYVLPDAITIVLLLQMCGQLGSLNLGSMAHGYSFTKGFFSHLSVENAVLDMYMRCRSMENAEQLFRLMNVKNTVTWNTMLSGYAKLASYLSIIEMFSQMQSDGGCNPDSVTFISLIQAFATVSSGHGADVAHSFVIKLGFGCETAVINSLIDAYAKNGAISNASSLFVHLGQMRDKCSWNVIIAGCGINGQGEQACELLNKMSEDGYEPDSITFTSLLSACAHCGMIDEGCRYIDLMINKYKICLDLEHWTAIIDMLGRAGRLEEAYQLIMNNMGQIIFSSLDYGAVWGAFLDACRMYNNVELGELAGRKVLRLSPQNSGYPILLSNLLASVMRWDESAEARRVFNDGNLAKEVGFSSVEM